LLASVTAVISLSILRASVLSCFTFSTCKSRKKPEKATKKHEKAEKLQIQKARLRTLKSEYF